jgi:hypothetical protein
MMFAHVISKYDLLFNSHRCASPIKKHLNRALKLIVSGKPVAITELTQQIVKSFVAKKPTVMQCTMAVPAIPIMTTDANIPDKIAECIRDETSGFICHLS